MTQPDLPPAPWIGPGEPKGPFAPPRAGMQGRYLLRSERSAKAMAWLDRMLSLVPKRHAIVPERFDRILLANWGHLGDVVTTQGAIAALRDRHPGVEIGMIVANAGRPAIENANLVDRLHIIDHWWVSRADWSGKEKRRHFRETRDRALAEIGAARYQLGIDFYPFFPPAHPLFFRAGIPVRVGYTSGGFSPLLTHPVPWPDRRVPIAEQYLALLNVVHDTAPFAAGALRPRRDRATLRPVPSEVSQARPYVVLHPGAGATYKEWDIAHWCELARRLIDQAPQRRLVVTGAGDAEKAMAARIAGVSSNVINMAGRADWETFVAIIAHADIVVCPDTATGHVAAAVDVPVVSIFTGTNIAEQWQPYTVRNRLLVEPVRCAPCNRPGCEAMACIKPTSPERVLAAMADLTF